MTENSPAGPTFGEIYWAAHLAAIPDPDGSGLAFADLPEDVRATIEAGAQAVADAVRNGPGPGTVIVTTDGGTEIRFTADEFDADGALDIRDTSRKANTGIVATYAVGRWASVRLDGVTAPGRGEHQVDIARRTEPESGPADAAAEAVKIADAANAVLDLFGRSSDGWHARISGVNLMRAYKAIGRPVPDRLAHLEHA